MADTTKDAPAPAAEAPAASVAVEAADGGAASSGDAAAEMFKPSVKEHLLTQLVDMGFPEVRAHKALYHTGDEDIGAAVTWLGEHGDDEDIDEPLLVEREAAPVTSNMTAEEKAAKLEELRARARERKAKKEAEDAREAEKLRRLRGQDLSKARESARQKEIEKMAQERRREKAEAKAAKEKIRAELAKDRAERRARMGLPPEEPTATPDAIKRREASERAAAEAAMPEVPLEEFKPIVAELQKQCGDDEAKWAPAVKLLYAYLKNLVEKPTEEKFRQINTENKVFVARLKPYPAAVAYLNKVGFEADGTLLKLPAKPNLRTVRAAQGALPWIM